MINLCNGFIAIGQKSGYQLVSVVGLYGKSVDLIGNNAGDYYVYMKDWQNPITTPTDVTLELIWKHL